MGPRPTVGNLRRPSSEPTADVDRACFSGGCLGRVACRFLQDLVAVPHRPLLVSVNSMTRNNDSIIRTDAGGAFPVVAAALPVVANDMVGDDYWHMRLQAGDAHLAAVAGQFFHLRCPAGDAGTPFLRRPMSVYGVDANAGEIAFLYKVSGVGTTGLSRLTAGDTLDVMGPLGQGFTINPEWEHALIVARGVGIATMAPLADALRAAGVAMTAVCSYRHPDAAVGLDPFLRRGRVVTVFDSEGSSDIEGVRRLLVEMFDERPFDHVFTCGSARLIRLLQELSQELGYRGQAAVEQQMACALGMCHACVVDVRHGDLTRSERVCTTGPVFDLGSVL